MVGRVEKVQLGIPRASRACLLICSGPYSAPQLRNSTSGRDHGQKTLQLYLKFVASNHESARHVVPLTVLRDPSLTLNLSLRAGCPAGGAREESK